MMAVRFYSIKKVAEMLEVSKATIERRVNEGFFPNFKRLPVSGEIRISEDDYNDFIGIKPDEQPAPQTNILDAYDLYVKNLAKEGIKIGRKKIHVA